MKKTLENQKINSEGIDRLSEMAGELLEQSNVDRSIATRTRLVLETLLENISRHYEEEIEIGISFTKRLGIKTLDITWSGEKYNPTVGDDVDEWTATILSEIAMAPTYRHRKKSNKVSIRLPRNKLREEVYLVLAFVIAIGLGFAGEYIPDNIVSSVTEYGLVPAADIFMNMLMTFAGILVFLCVVTGVCGLGSVREFSKIGRTMTSRYIITSFLGCGVCVLLALPFYSLTIVERSADFRGKAIFEMVLNIIPKDPVTPFMNGNMLQIVFMGILVGVGLLVFGSELNRLREVIIQAKKVIVYIVELICGLLPIYIIASLTKLFWSKGMGIFATIWKPFIICMVLCHIVAFAAVASASIRCKVSPFLLMKKMLSSYIVGFTTASASATMGTMFEVNEKRLGIPISLSQFGVPLGSLICNSAVGGIFVGIIYYVAEFSGTDVSVGWFVGVWLVTTILSFAMPPVAGGPLVCLEVMFAAFHLPVDCMGIAVTLIMLTDFAMTSTRVMTVHMELAIVAKHNGTLDMDMLKSRDVNAG